MKYFKNDDSDFNSSEETVYCIETINHLAYFFFSNTDVVLDSSPDSTENGILPSVPTVSERNSKFIDSGSTVQTSSNSENFNFSSESLLTPTVTVQKPPLSPLPVAPAITPAITPRPIYIPDPSDIDSLPFPRPLQLLVKL